MPNYHFYKAYCCRVSNSLFQESCLLKLIGGIALCQLLVFISPCARADESFVRNGVAGFVVSDFKFALGPDAEVSGTCPLGMTKNVADIYAISPGGKPRDGESVEAYRGRVMGWAKQFSTNPDGSNVCMKPEEAAPDPYFRVVERSDIPVDGINLDGEISANDFSGIGGEKGVDNQYYRVVGCNHSYQSTGSSNSFAIEMLTGSWGILISLSDVDDIHNDDYVAVGLYANADPIRLSPDRKPLSFASYTVDPEQRYRATTTGKIVNGVLTTEPVDVRFHSVVNSMYLERVLKDARLKAELSEEGVLGGYLAGYSPVEAIYDAQFGFRNGKTAEGTLAPDRLRMGSSNGAAYVLGYTCQGVYEALNKYADGHPDPETGKFTSISTQYRFQAIPAFVINPQEEHKLANDTVAQHED